MDVNPYASSNAGSYAKPSPTAGRWRILIRRVIGVPLGGFAICLVAEFVADYFDVFGFRGNNVVTTKLLRAFGANAIFAIPYLILSSPLVLLRTADTRRLICYPLLGGAIGVLVPRTLIGYGWEVQTAVGLNNTTLFFFAAGCGAIAGSGAEIAVRIVTTVLRSTTPSAVDDG